MALLSTIMFLFQLGFGGFCATKINVDWFTGMFPEKAAKWIGIVLKVIIFLVGMWIGWYVFILLCVILVLKML